MTVESTMSLASEYTELEEDEEDVVETKPYHSTVLGGSN